MRPNRPPITHSRIIKEAAKNLINPIDPVIIETGGGNNFHMSDSNRMIKFQ